MQHNRNGPNRPNLPEVISAISQMGSTEDTVAYVRDTFAFDHVTYQMAPIHTTPAPFIRSTYPPQWISRYVLRGYFSVDPVVRTGFATTQPFAWHELTLSARELEFMVEAHEHGIGSNGYSIPIADRFFRRALLTLTSGTTLENWAEFVEATASCLIQIAHLIHDKAIEELPAVFQPAPTLAPREAECLLWTARGKEAKAIAAILELSEYTVRSYLRTARKKLDCRTLSQAVAKAVQAGIINP